MVVEIVQTSSNGTIENKGTRAPLFNSEHLLSKPIPELVGSGFNLCVQLSLIQLELADFVQSHWYAREGAGQIRKAMSYNLNGWPLSDP